MGQTPVIAPIRNNRISSNNQHSLQQGQQSISNINTSMSSTTTMNDQPLVEPQTSTADNQNPSASENGASSTEVATSSNRNRNMFSSFGSLRLRRNGDQNNVANEEDLNMASSSAMEEVLTSDQLLTTDSIGSGRRRRRTSSSDELRDWFG